MRVTGRTAAPHLVAYAAVALAAGGFSYAVAAEQSATQTKLFACAKKNGGTLRLVAERTRCRKSERKVSWAIAGPAGTQGPAGAPGTAGPAGSNAQFDGAAAGGDLSGTFPNPQLGAGVVGAPELAPGAVEAGKLAAGAVGASSLGTIVVRTAISTVGDGENSSAFAECAAGEEAISGGGSLDSFVSDVPLLSSRPSTVGGGLPANGQPLAGWRATAINPAGGTGGTVSVRAHVLCLQP